MAAGLDVGADAEDEDGDDYYEDEALGMAVGNVDLGLKLGV